MSKEIGKIIQDRRNELRLYLKDIAKVCDVSVSTVARWESGETDNIKRGNLYLLSKTLYIPIEVLIGVETDKKLEPVDVILKRKQLHTLIDNVKDLETLEKIGQIITMFIKE